MEALRQFDLLQNDPNAWEEQAEGLLISAKLVQEKFKEVQRIPAPLGNTRLEQLAYFDAFMLLTAFAFENLIKGLGVAKGMNWKRDFLERGGHGIADFAGKVTIISAEEDDLLKRLQVFSIWAGRYPIPTSTGKYQMDAPNRRFSFPKDADLIEAFSTRLKREIRSARK